MVGHSIKNEKLSKGDLEILRRACKVRDKFRQFSELDFSEQGLTDKDIGDIIAIVKDNLRVVTLDLSHNNISQVGMQLLAGELKGGHAPASLATFKHEGNLDNERTYEAEIAAAFAGHKNLVRTEFPPGGRINIVTTPNSEKARSLMKLLESPEVLPHEAAGEISERIYGIMAVAKDEGADDKRIGTMLMKAVKEAPEFNVTDEMARMVKAAGGRIDRTTSGARVVE